jgi:hypothetical protein
MVRWGSGSGRTTERQRNSFGTAGEGRFIGRLLHTGVPRTKGLTGEGLKERPRWSAKWSVNSVWVRRSSSMIQLSWGGRPQEARTSGVIAMGGNLCAGFGAVLGPVAHDEAELARGGGGALTTAPLAQGAAACRWRNDGLERGERRGALEQRARAEKSSLVL